MKIQDEMPSDWGEWVNPKKDLMGEPAKLKLAPRKEQCPCGKIVENRRVNISFIQLQKHRPNKVQSKTCALCYKWYNPVEDEWQTVEHNHRRPILIDYRYRRDK